MKTVQQPGNRPPMIVPENDIEQRVLGQLLELLVPHAPDPSFHAAWEGHGSASYGVIGTYHVGTNEESDIWYINSDLLPTGFGD